MEIKTATDATSTEEENKKNTNTGSETKEEINKEKEIWEQGCAKQLKKGDLEMA